ncbi:MAG: hypothetical protein WCJ40_06230 [Planctomycetota bacterium]|jgi:hypothetical protein|nr:hypothetical protein [Planctomycetota bacterium]RLS24601.1 MAG: hypothetical protein DWH73_03160 [Planctomycetota bacterium]
MSIGIAMAMGDLPVSMRDLPEIRRRIYERGGEPEVRFMYDDRQPVLPVWKDGGLELVWWGNGRGRSRCLPRTGWTWKATIEQGGWGGSAPGLVRIVATLGLEKGIWYRVRQGMHGLLVVDEQAREAVYMICEPATHYYQVMTRSSRMPALLEEQI